MRNVLVVVHSLTGASRNLAKLLCAQQDWDMVYRFPDVARLIGRAPILSTTFTTRDDSCAAHLQTFGAALARARDSQQAVRPMQFA